MADIWSPDGETSTPLVVLVTLLVVGLLGAMAWLWVLPTLTLNAEGTPTDRAADTPPVRSVRTPDYVPPTVGESPAGNARSSGRPLRYDPEIVVLGERLKNWTVSGLTDEPPSVSLDGELQLTGEFTHLVDEGMIVMPVLRLDKKSLEKLPVPDGVKLKDVNLVVDNPRADTNPYMPIGSSGRATVTLDRLTWFEDKAFIRLSGVTTVKTGTIDVQQGMPKGSWRQGVDLGFDGTLYVQGYVARQPDPQATEAGLPRDFLQFIPTDSTNSLALRQYLNFARTADLGQELIPLGCLYPTEADRHELYVKRDVERVHPAGSGASWQTKLAGTGVPPYELEHLDRLLSATPEDPVTLQLADLDYEGIVLPTCSSPFNSIRVLLGTRRS